MFVATVFTLVILLPTLLTLVIFVATVSISDVASFKSSATVSTSDTASAKSFATATTFVISVATVLTEPMLLATVLMFAEFELFDIADMLPLTVLIAAILLLTLLRVALSDADNQVFSK